MADAGAHRSASDAGDMGGFELGHKALDNSRYHPGRSSNICDFDPATVTEGLEKA